MDLKKCTKCGVEKPISAFYSYRNDCKDCISAKSRERYLLNKDKIIAQVSSRYHANPEPVKQYHREFYKANKEKIREDHAIYRHNNKEDISKRRAKKHQERKGERLAFREAHPKAHWATATTYDHHIHKLFPEVLEMAEKTSVCPICNCVLKYAGKETVAWHSASLDRKYNDDSRNIEDFWIICRHCNLTKRERSIEEMDTWCFQWQKARQYSP